MTGRPTKLTPERFDLIIEGIESGMSVAAVAELAGIHRTTLLEWVARGRDANPTLNPDEHTKTQLRTLAKDAGLPTTGTKAELAQRLNEAAPETIFADFAYQYARARGQLQKDLLEHFQAAAERSRDWRAYAWLLERKFPADFALSSSDVATDAVSDVEARAALERGKAIALKIEQADNVHQLPARAPQRALEPRKRRQA